MIKKEYEKPFINVVSFDTINVTNNVNILSAQTTFKRKSGLTAINRLHS